METVTSSGTPRETQRWSLLQMYLISLVHLRRFFFGLTHTKVRSSADLSALCSRRHRQLSELDPYRTPATPSTPSLSHSHSSGASSSSMTLAQFSSFSNMSQCSDSPSSPSTVYTSRLGQGYGYSSNYSLDAMIQAKMDGGEDPEVLETYELFEGFGRKPRQENICKREQTEQPVRNRSQDSARAASACSNDLQAARDLVIGGNHQLGPSRMAAALDVWAPR